LKVSTGRVIFQDVEPGGEPGDRQALFSPPIQHGLNVNSVAIVMAVEVLPEGEEFRVMGDPDVLDAGCCPSKP
jgi:hypothetical protein